MKYLIAGVCCLSLLLTPACQTIDPLETETIEFSIDSVVVSDILVLHPDFLATVTCWLTHNDGSDGLDSVYVTIKSVDGQTEYVRFTMSDAGDAGDVIAGDNVYTRQFSADGFGIAAGTVSIDVTAVPKDGETLQSLPIMRSAALPGTPPAIVNITAPDTLLSGTDYTIVLEAFDFDGAAEIESATMRLLQNGNEIESFFMRMDSSQDQTAYFSVGIDNSFAAERQGDYLLSFSVQDTATLLSEPFLHNIYLENEAPQIHTLSMPDTLVLPDVDAISAFITVVSTDPQGAGDIESVFFNSTKPDGEPSGSNPFVLYDNGLPYDAGNPEATGDEIANDDVFSLTIFLPAGTPTGPYVFEFFSRDRVGQETVGPVDTLHVVKE